MSEKKVARIESVAFALGIICIILTLILVDALEIYPPMINDRNNKIISVQNQVNSLTNTLDMGNATVWVNNETYNQKAGSYNLIEAPIVYYSGYIFVNVQTSTTNTTYARVIYRY